MSLQLFNLLKVAAEHLSIPSLGDTWTPAVNAAVLYHKVKDRMSGNSSSGGGDYRPMTPAMINDRARSKVLQKLQETSRRKWDLDDFNNVTKATSLIPGLSPISSTARALTAAGGAAGVGPAFHRTLSRALDGLKPLGDMIVKPFEDEAKHIQIGKDLAAKSGLKPRIPKFQDVMKKLNQESMIAPMGDTLRPALDAFKLHRKVLDGVTRIPHSNGDWSNQPQRMRESAEGKVVSKLRDDDYQKWNLNDFDNASKVTSLIPGLSPISNTARALTAAGSAAGIWPAIHRTVSQSVDGLEPLGKMITKPFKDEAKHIQIGKDLAAKSGLKPRIPKFQDVMKKLNQDTAMQTPHIKTASEATPARLAAIDKFDGEQAFELGFAKAAHDLGLNEQQYAQFYQAGIAKLQALQK